LLGAFEEISMKKSIEWHKEGLVNSTRHAKTRREEVERALAAVERLEQRNRLTQAQIELAIKEGKDGFDAERYAVKRLCV
jgi:hypothetical protein